MGPNHLKGFLSIVHHRSGRKERKKKRKMTEKSDFLNRENIIYLNLGKN
jgi:hypothetical protein